jgi:hypothetical protein
MIKKYPLLLVTAFIAILTSCKKDFEDFDKLDNQGSTVGGTYLPMDKGNKWVYNLTSELVSNGVPVQEMVTMTGKKVMLEGKEYYEAVANLPALNINSNAYLNYDKGVYSSKSDNAQAGIAVISKVYDENQPIGKSVYTETDLDVANDFKMRTNLSTVEKGISKTVNNVTYEDVIHTQVIYEFKLGKDSEWVSLTIEDFYLAKNVGPIATLTKSVSGEQISKEELVSFTKGK